MAFQRVQPMALNLVRLFCLVRVLNNGVSMVNAQQMNNNPSDNEKGVNVVVEADPNQNMNIEKKSNPTTSLSYSAVSISTSADYSGVSTATPSHVLPTYYTTVAKVYPEDTDNIPGGALPLLFLQ